MGPPVENERISRDEDSGWRRGRCGFNNCHNNPSDGGKGTERSAATSMGGGRNRKKEAARETGAADRQVPKKAHSKPLGVPQ